MSGKLIALESTDQPLLDKTAKYLALKLQSEGHNVEIMSFPQKKQSSSHFIDSHQKGEYGQVNPYAASMFYILDRYDASTQIKQYIDQDTIVICKSYRGSSLAKLGAQISDGPTRKGFYIWADSLESGTFGVLRPDIAIILSEELPTLYELCELFPKDYVFAIDPTKIRTLLNKIIPPAPIISKKSPTYATTWLQALTVAGKGDDFDFMPGKHYAKLPKNSKIHKLYADNLHELEVLKAKVIKKMPSKLISEATQLVTPIGINGSTKNEQMHSKYLKNKTFDTQLVEYFEPTYGTATKGTKLLYANPRNELDCLPALLLPKTEQSISDFQKSLDQTPIRKKIKLFKSYLNGVDKDPLRWPLTVIQFVFAATVSYSDLQILNSFVPSARFNLQTPSPRWGYEVPVHLAFASNEIEDCFVSSIKLYSQLEAAGEQETANQIVLAGNFVQSVITIDAAAVRTIAKISQNHPNWRLGQELTAALAEQYPLLTEV